MTLLQTYQQQFQTFYKTTGQMPVVAVLGHEDYMTLKGELQLFFGFKLDVPPKEQDSLKVYGISIFAGSMPTGIYFGGHPQ